MTKKSKDIVQSQEDLVPDEVVVTEVVTTKPQPPLPVKKFTFEQWASQFGIKESHKSGMRAFCKNPEKLRTIEDWSKLFEAY